MDHQKNRSEKSVDRRDFLKTGAAALGTAAVAGATAKTAVGGPTGSKSSIPTRKFGKTGLTLPILGYGGAALPKMWGNPLSTEDRVKVVRYAYDRGIRYFDTAGNYMESQAILGEALKDVRKDVCLVGKVETTDPKHVRPAVEKSLKELQTDYLDGILIHGTPGLEQMSIERAMQVHAELAKLRDEGVAKFLGLSAHSYFDKALACISTGQFDQCMLCYGYIPRGHNQIFSARNLELRNACVAKARELGMGIVAMKVVAAGVLGGWAPYIVPSFDKKRVRQLPAAAIRYALDDGRIDVLTIGMRLKTDIDDNIRTVTGDPTYTMEDRALLADYSTKAFETKALKSMKIE